MAPVGASPRFQLLYGRRYRGASENPSPSSTVSIGTAGRSRCDCSVRLLVRDGANSQVVEPGGDAGPAVSWHSCQLEPLGLAAFVRDGEGDTEKLPVCRSFAGIRTRPRQNPTGAGADRTPCQPGVYHWRLRPRLAHQYVTPRREQQNLTNEDARGEAVVFYSQRPIIYVQVVLDDSTADPSGGNYCPSERLNLVVRCGLEGSRLKQRA